MSQFQPPQSGLPPQPQQATGYPQWQQPPYPPQPEMYYAPQQTPIPGLSPTPPPRKPRTRNFLALVAAVALVIVGGAFTASALSYQPIPTAPTPTPDFVQASANASLTSIAQDQATSAALTATAALQPTDQPTPTAPPVTPTTPTPTFTTFGDGNYQVGTDIKPGTYRTRSGSTNCYYERLKGFSGSLGDILANNNTDNPAIVTILPTDKGFNSQNCGTWTNDLSQITTSKTSFSDGMYFVSVDIAPGTYKNTASQNCYYARLSGFSNTFNDIIANNNTDAAAIITIVASDKGFESTNCGTWTKI